ncbi:MAG: hypothetical protein AVDCRST_MAG76-2174 [uncultured Acidimicrobiales bacterium]|uniref:Activator of Hsp90 ATPase homologue 1/2-like C-terminal domain-containing protein n=1 Tax=uncultured Acidimicrobiales bacterium TaxID=310071 RepID=A0A6J4IDN1_9ACTN|nr:MAG: hypothetical protein AVDCRST_MAG76-2174 [uncultured Acidimicrobiales bacterium]
MGQLSITRSVELEAPVDHVWEAVTTPALLSRWLDGAVDLDVRPGGEGTIIEPDGAVRRAQVEEVEPARRLALQWWPEDGSSPASRVELDLEPTPGGTRLLVTETVLNETSITMSARVATSARWDIRLLLLGCSLLRSPVACG